MIFSTHPLHPEIEAALKTLGRLVIASAPTPDAIDKESGGAGIIIVRAPIAPEIVKREQNLKALVRHGAGLDMIPVNTATKQGVIVANVPGANAITVAEHVIWSAAALLRRHPEVRHGLQNGWENGRAFAPTGREISGRILGIVGMGNVGKSLARIAVHGFGMKVKTHTRSKGGMPEGVEAVSLKTLLSTSDVVALCCPLNDETRGMIGEEELAAMRPDAVLVNVSRGPVVDENALIAALASGRLRGAALDVFDVQPMPADHPFMAMSNVILTPHMAGITEESMKRMGQGVLDQVRQILKGDTPENFINPVCLPRYKERFNLN